MLFRAIVYGLAILIAAIGLAGFRSRSARQVLLLLLSYALYVTWGWWFAIVLLASTITNFLMGKSLRRRRSALTLWTGIALNVGLLSSFKYLPEFAHSLPIGWLQEFSRVVLPLGLSFWTFQAMSYLFDLYGGEQLEPSFVEFALYMAFFPVQISGPICRLPDMLPQFRSEQPAQRSDVVRGLCRIATGALMMGLGQLLGRGILNTTGINSGFDQLTRWSGPDVWCLAFGYGLQLFFDFAGYSHIAIGAGKILGFTLPENFARPYTSTSVSIFWTRQHMSLSFWIRDYVYIPMAMWHGEEWWGKFSLLLSMVLFGVWHKATVLFVLFGCYHGTLLILHREWEELRRRFRWKPPALIWTSLSWLATISLISLGWIFFRANSLSQAGAMFSALLSPSSYATHLTSGILYLLVCTLAAGYAAVLLVIAALDRYSQGLGVGEATPRSEIIAIAVRDRWIWVAPLWAAASVLVLTTLPQHGRAANLFMYRFF